MRTRTYNGRSYKSTNTWRTRNTIARYATWAKYGVMVAMAVYGFNHIFGGGF